MKFPTLLRPRTIWLPTVWGWSLLFLLFAAPSTWWCFRGEQLLAADVPVPPEVLIVDGWIKAEPIEAAGEIFRRDGYTRGAHAWRSLIVYRRVFGPAVQVGVISWKPPGFESEGWWRSSSRAEEFIKETIGCVWEGLFASGRGL